VVHRTREGERGQKGSYGEVEGRIGRESILGLIRDGKKTNPFFNHIFASKKTNLFVKVD
jgi:hypothetical protein